MIRLALIMSIACYGAPGVGADKAPRDDIRVLVLDDCDPVYEGKEVYGDQLTAVTSSGVVAFQVSGFNNCQTTGSTRQIAWDPKRTSIWTAEIVARRVCRYDAAGIRTLEIPNLKATAIAVDPETGALWAMCGNHILIYSSDGVTIGNIPVSGSDLIYEKFSGSFWVSGKELTKISRAGRVLLRMPVAIWTIRCIEADNRSGDIWVADGEHPNVPGSKDRLIRFSNDGSPQVIIPGRSAKSLSVDPVDSSLLVSGLGSFARYSTDGRLLKTRPYMGQAVVADSPAGSMWMTTDTEIIRFDVDGSPMTRYPLAGETGMAWMLLVPDPEN